MKAIQIPQGKVRTQDDEAAKRKRIEIREKLLQGEEVKVTTQGNIVPAKDNPSAPGIVVEKGKLASNEPNQERSDIMKAIQIPQGKVRTQDDEAAKRKRIEIREKLLQGEEVKVTTQGNIVPAKDNPSAPGIVVEKGKLAAFHWYQADPELLQDEQEAMTRFFPQFRVGKLDDGRIFWYGTLSSGLLKKSRWDLMAVYNNNHPNNSTYGGSVKVYAVIPDLEEIQNRLGEAIPHTLHDSQGDIYLCTARMEDIQAGDCVTSAATSISWAVKWIAAFELWMSGDLSTEQFAGHAI